MADDRQDGVVSGVSEPQTKTWEQDYPQHARLDAAQPGPQIIGGFLEWLEQQGVRLCVYVADNKHPDWGKRTTEGFHPWCQSIPDVIALHYGIDRRAFVEEKQAMLDEYLRSVQIREQGVPLSGLQPEPEGEAT